MKIALINNASSNSGIGKYAFNIFREYRKMGETADMIYLRCRDEKLNVNEDRIDVVESPFKFAGMSLNLILYFSKKLPEGYDVYHYTNQILSILCNLRHPSIITCHDLIPLELKEYVRYDLVQYVFSRLTTRYMKYAERIITNSEYSKKRIIKHLKISEGKIDVIYYGIDHDVFKLRDKLKTRENLGLPKNKKIILNVGSEEPRKNVLTLFKALYKLNKSNPNVLLIRIGEKNRQVKALTDHLGLNNKIIYTGPMPNRDVALFYSSADLYVSPSYYEGFGLTPLESMASGCPVICGDIAASREIIGDAGILVNPFDVSALAGKMREVLINSALREALIKRGLKRAKMFTWHKAAKKMLKVYEEITR